MPETIDLSQNYEIGLIGPDKMTTLIEDDALLACAPPTYSDTGLVVWEQPENGYGLLSMRGQGGVPDTTKDPGRQLVDDHERHVGRADGHREAARVDSGLDSETNR